VVFFVILGILLIGGLATFLGGRLAKSQSPEGDGNLVAVGALFATAVGVVLLILFSSISSVDPGHIGVKKSFGKYDQQTTGNGYILHAPWTNVISLSVQNRIREYDMGKGNSAVSSDSQPVYLTVQVNYQLKPQEAVNLYQSTAGDYVNRILDPNVYQLTKEVTAQYRAVDFAKNRETIRRKIEKALSDAVNPQGLQINNVALKNVDFTDALSKAIERTVEANQNAKQAQAQVAVVEAKAKQAVAQATGIANAKITEARGEATAQKLKNRTLTAKIIQQQAIQAIAPTDKTIIICQNGQCPSILPVTPKG